MNPREIVDGLFGELTSEIPAIVTAAVGQWPEVAALIVERAIADAAEKQRLGTSRIDNVGHMLALEIFGHQRDPSTWPAVHALCTMSADVAEYHLSGLAMTSLGQIIYRTSAGQLELMAGILGNPSVHPQIREAALEGLQYALADGAIERQAFLDLTVAMLADPALDDAGQLPLVLQDAVLELRPHEYAAELRALAATQADDSQSPASLEELLREDSEFVEGRLLRRRNARESYEPEDVFERMSTWLPMDDTAWLDEVAQGRGSAVQPGPARKVSKADRAQRKRKQQIADKARKANRKRK